MLQHIVWDVKPTIFGIGNFQLRYYSLLFALGFIIGYLIVKRFFKRENIELKELDNLLVYIIVGALVGARLGHCLFYDWAYFSNHILEIFLPVQFSPFRFTGFQGLASHGGAIGILITLALFIRKSKTIKNYLQLLDYIAIPTALAGGFIRLGNLMNSEIYGHQTDLPWGFIFVRNGDTWASHPTQIYEALAYFTIFVVLLVLYNKNWQKKIHGMYIGLFLIMVFTFRFFVEYVKEVHMALNMGQILSIPFIIVGIALLWYSLRKRGKVAE